MSPFVSCTTINKYCAKGHNITLQLEQGVFCPSEHGGKIGEYISLNNGETVLDMGTGTGILGIIAAKEGGIVDISDPFENAVNLALKNFSLNNVTAKGYVGEYFCTPKKEYDYIIANLPQEILPYEYSKKIGTLERAINGGILGNDHILNFLGCAHEHMHDNSRILMVAYTVSDYISTLSKINSFYRPKLLDVITSPAKDFVQENIEYYIPLIESGKVGLFKKDGLWQSTIMIYELKKK